MEIGFFCWMEWRLVLAIKIFISYAHEDEADKDRLQVFLEDLKQRKLIETWTDRKINGGDKWKKKISKALDKCHMAILLVSADFIASNFIRSVELKRLYKRKKEDKILIVPIIIKTCPWKKTSFSKFQFLPTDGKAIATFSKENDGINRAWTEVTNKLELIATELNKSLSAPDKKSKIVKQSTPEITDTSRMPQPAAALVGRGDERQLLNGWLADSQVYVAGVIAGGGVGKSALVDGWLQDLMPGYGGAKRVFAWSFYSQGSHETQTSSTLFFNSALDFFGHTGEIPQVDEEKAVLLAELLAERPSLLILDGVEPLQYPPDVEEGRFSDPGLYRFSRILASKGLGGYSKNSLVLITSRQEILSLNIRKGGLYQQINLGPLSVDDGRELLKSLGVTTGLKREFNATVKKMAGHGLGLVLLGRLLKQQHGGDIARADQVKDLFAAQGSGDHAKRVMQHYEEKLWQKDGPEVAFLRLMGLFDRPMGVELFLELKEKAEIALGLKEIPGPKINQMVANLESIGLILPDKEEGVRAEYDAHPLVREYFGQKFLDEDPDRFRQAHRVLFEYFQKVPEKDQPDTLEELEPLYRAMHHGCKAEEYKKAWEDVYYVRIMRGGEGYSSFKLGAYSSDLAAVSGFFPNGWGSPPVKKGLYEEYQCFVLAEASFCLMSLGRMTEAVGSRRMVMQIHEKREDLQNAAVGALNLVDLLLPTGGVSEAEERAEQAIEWIGKTEDKFRQMVSHSKLANTLHRLGKMVDSQEAFQETERLQNERQPEYPRLYSQQGAQYCAFKLEMAQGKADYVEVLERGNEIIDLYKNTGYNRLLCHALNHLTIARAQAALEKNTVAQIAFVAAVDGIRKAGKIEFLPDFLNHRASFLRQQGEQEKGRHDLDEALETAIRCGMDLYEADGQLLKCHYLLDEGKIDEAEIALLRGEELVEKMGYGQKIVEMYTLIHHQKK
jgi:tetratricopeptide (TPR) repeat protein